LIKKKKEEKEEIFLIRLSGLVRGPHTTLLPEGSGGGGRTAHWKTTDCSAVRSSSAVRTHTQTRYTHTRARAHADRGLAWR